MKLVYENINSFVRNQDPIKSLDLGYEGKIRNFFRSCNVSDDYYKISKEDNEIIVKGSLNLAHNHNIIELPDNLYINGHLNLNLNYKLSKLPNNLYVGIHLYIIGTNITELPDDLVVEGNIWISGTQVELLKFIQNSKFKHKLIY